MKAKKKIREKIEISKVKTLFKLYEKKRTLESKLEDLWEERDRVVTTQGLVFISAVAIFLLSFLFGVFLLNLHKIFGGFLLGIPAGMFIYLCASSKWDDLDKEIEELDKKIDELRKEIKQIEKEVIGDE